MIDSLQPPSYLEGYPQINMVRAQAATEKGFDVCEFADAVGRIHGLARFGAMTRDSIVLEYEITLPYVPCAHSSIKLNLVEAPNGVDENRIITSCPKCDQNRILLVYNNGWACSNCHGLLYRSQTVSKYTLLFEKLNSMNLAIKRGRLKGMRHTTFAALRKKRSALSRKLRHLTVQYASEQQNQIIYSRWKRQILNHSLFFNGPMGADNY